MRNYTPATPFWSSASESLSKKIWNPEDYKNELVEEKTLYMTKTTHPFYDNQVIKAETINQSDEKIIVSKKVRFYPTKEQKVYLYKYLSAHRYFYNKTVEDINNQYDKRKQEFESKSTCIFCYNPKEENSYSCLEHKNKPIPWKINTGFFDLRTKLVKTKNNLKGYELWQEEIPCHTKQLAVKDAVTAYKSAITNKFRGNIKQFRLNFISKKKKPTHIFWITPTSVSIKNEEVRIFPNVLNKNSFLQINPKQKHKIPIKNESAVKILYDRRAWYLVFSVEEKVETKCDNLHSIALDPGIRTFQTGYSPNGSVYKFGEYQLNEMKKIHSRIDKLKSASSTANYRKRYNIKKRLTNLEFKLRGIIHNLHNQVGSFLCKNYKYILLPKFETSDIQQSDNIHSTTKRRMTGLAHYQFQLKMEHFSRKYGSQLNIVDESYTSKTCGSCGKIKEDLGSAFHYNCSSCSYHLDRDIHGARNIWIKAVSL
jgi:transposase